MAMESWPFVGVVPVEAKAYGCFLKWWYPTTMGFPTKNDHFGVFWGYHHFRKPPYVFLSYFKSHVHALLTCEYFFSDGESFCTSPFADRIL